MKVPVIQRNEYTVYYERVEQYTFIHCDCYKWNKTVKRQMQQDAKVLIELHREPLYAVNTLNDKKRLKFLHTMGFDFLTEFLGTDGNNHQMFIRK